MSQHEPGWLQAAGAHDLTGTHACGGRGCITVQGAQRYAVSSTYFTASTVTLSTTSS
jgi:hypothetical protein